MIMDTRAHKSIVSRTWGCQDSEITFVNKSKIPVDQYNPYFHRPYIPPS